MGVRVSVLCPGVVRTPIGEGGKFGKALVDLPAENLKRLLEDLGPVTPEAFAREALDGVARNAPIIVVPARWKWIWWMNRLSTPLGLFLAGKHFEKALKSLSRQA